MISCTLRHRYAIHTFVFVERLLSAAIPQNVYRLRSFRKKIHRRDMRRFRRRRSSRRTSQPDQLRALSLGCRSATPTGKSAASTDHSLPSVALPYRNVRCFHSPTEAFDSRRFLFYLGRRLRRIRRGASAVFSNGSQQRLRTMRMHTV